MVVICISKALEREDIMESCCISTRWMGGNISLAAFTTLMMASSRSQAWTLNEYSVKFL